MTADDWLDVRDARGLSRILPRHLRVQTMTISDQLLEALELSQLAALQQRPFDQRCAVRQRMRDMYDALERMLNNHGDLEHDALTLAIGELRKAAKR